MHQQIPWKTARRFPMLSIPAQSSFQKLYQPFRLYQPNHLVFSLDHQVVKNRYSPFINNSSELPHLLKTLKRSQLIFCGVLLNVCVESSIRDAMQLDFEPILISDATTSVDRIVYEVSLFNIKLFFGDVYNTEEIIEEYHSISEAARKNNLEKANISKICNNYKTKKYKTKYQTCGGFKWKFKD